MTAERYAWHLYASHHQFHLEDDGDPGDAGNEGFWSEEASADMLAMGPRIIAVVTASYGRVRVVLELHHARPPLEPEPWDHIVEGSIDLPSGRIRLIGCLDDAWMVKQVPAGSYRVRCHGGSLAGGVEYGDGADHYLLQLWRAPHAARHVLKRWTEPTL